MTSFTPQRLITRETPKQILSEDFKKIEWPISGGWGYTQEDAAIIDADNSSSAISVERLFIEYKTYEELIIFRPKGQRFSGIKINMRRQYLIRDDQGRSYDKIEYRVTALPEADFVALKADAEAINELPDPFERMKRFDASMKAREERLVTFDELPEADSEYYLNKVIREGLNITGGAKRDKDGSFYYGESSRGYSIEDGATDIGPMAFYGCPDLEYIDIPEGVVEIRDKAFYGCANLVEVHQPSTLRKIGFEAFRGCSKLERINIPKSVQMIERGAFEGCEKCVIPNDAQNNFYFFCGGY